MQPMDDLNISMSLTIPWPAVEQNKYLLGSEAYILYSRPAENYIHMSLLGFLLRPT